MGLMEAALRECSDGEKWGMYVIIMSDDDIMSDGERSCGRKCDDLSPNMLWSESILSKGTDRRGGK